MATLESLRRRIDSSRQLQSVVKTMKTIAAASIRQFEQSAESIGEYRTTVELAMQITLKRGQPIPDTPPGTEKHLPLLAIVFGSSQGMCGQFNEDIIAFVTDHVLPNGNTGQKLDTLAIGDRITPYLEDHGMTPISEATLPYSVKGIGGGVHRVLTVLDSWYRSNPTGRIYIYHNHKTSGASYDSRRHTLIPLDTIWLHQLADKPWSSRTIPTFRMPRGDLFASLVRQYLFVALYQAFAESLAAENASRLAAMQAAESHIEEHLEELESTHNHLRQDSITAELLDIASGYEALQHGDS